MIPMREHRVLTESSGAAEKSRLASAGAEFHPEQILAGKGSRKCGPFRFRDRFFGGSSPGATLAFSNVGKRPPTEPALAHGSSVTPEFGRRPSRQDAFQSTPGRAGAERHKVRLMP